MSKFAFLAAIVLLAILIAVLPGHGQRDSRQDPQRGEKAGDADLAARRGALVDEIVFTQESDAGKVVGLIERGSHHVFAQGITNATVFHRLRDSERAGYEVAYGSSAELTLNPAGPVLANGELNPFHSPALREALNWLVNRRHVAEEIFAGMAVPRVLPLNTAFPDYARLAGVARALELRYAHDPERAKRVIHREMENLGASRRDGRWFYQGKAVRLIVLIRSEDERKQVGDYIANLLEDAGFEVERHYRTAQEASRIWIAGDPQSGRWHVYTGAWISTVINRDQSDNLSFYYTPRGRPEPLWQAYTPDPELDEIAERLQRRDYSDREERRRMMAQGIELALKDSVRIWLVDQINIGPRSSEVELAADLAGGISGSWLWPYTLRFRDRVGGRMVFAVPGILTEPWNPVAGSNWIFDVMITRALDDSELLPDPFTGLYRPQRIERAEVTVQEDVAINRTHDWLSLDTVARIQVPADTWIEWDSTAQRFVTAGEKYPQGVTARTRVRVYYEVDYFEHRWHDGSRVSLVDIVLPWILAFERADEDSRLFDPGTVPNFEVLRRHFRGWRILSRSPLIIEIYSDQVYPDAEVTVAARTPSAQPWHILVPGILAEQTGELAFTSDKADRMQVNWMSLVAGPSLEILHRHLQSARKRNWIPYAGQLNELLVEGEAAARYEALTDWYAQREHFWVGNGPFYLHSVYPVERAVVLRRYPDFPDPSDKWLRFTRPPIPQLELDGPLTITLDNAGAQTVSFELRISFDGKPYPREDLESVRYLLFDGIGALVSSGEAVPGNNGNWKIELAGEQLGMLGSGANSLEVAVISRRVALPAFASHAFATLPAAETAESASR